MPLQFSLLSHCRALLRLLGPCLLAVVGWLAVGLPAQALVLSASDGLKRAVDLTGAIAMQNDPTGRWRVDDVTREPQQRDFEPVDGPVEGGFTRDAVWLRFSLARTPDAPPRWLLRLRPARLNEATLYAPDGRGGFVETPLGDRRPFVERPIPDHNLVFPIDVATTAGDYFLRLRNEGPPLRAELDLWQPAGFDRFQSQDYAMIGLLLGAAILAVCMNLIFMAWLKNTLYGHYALYVLSTLALVLARQGYLAEWVLNDNPARVAQAVLAVNCVFNVIATLFMARIFGFRRHWPPAARFFDAVAVFNLLAFGVALTDWHTRIGVWVSVGSAASTVFGALFVCHLLFVRRQFQYWLPALAFSVGALGGIYGLLKLWLGDMVPGSTPERFYIFTTLTHLILLNIAVANRTRRAERALRWQRERALSLRIEAEQALEITVERRTAELAGANVALRDEIAKRSRLETRLLQSLDVTRRTAEQQHEFVSMVSHEFRTPLAVIDAAAQSLDLSKVGAEPAVKLRTARIRRSVQRLSMLIENILSADQLHLEQRALRVEPIDLELLAHGLCDSFNLPGSERLQLVVQHPLAEVRGDRSLIEIALQNLMHNALKYSPSESSVRVTLWQAGGTVQIDVTDHGSGVAEADAERIFEKYFRSDTVATVSGSGLGLHLAREIARRHGGDVRLVETGAEGSTFRLVLPSEGPNGAAR